MTTIREIMPRPWRNLPAKAKFLDSLLTQFIDVAFDEALDEDWFENVWLYAIIRYRTGEFTTAGMRREIEAAWERGAIDATTHRSLNYLVDQVERVLLAILAQATESADTWYLTYRTAYRAATNHAAANPAATANRIISEPTPHLLTAYPTDLWSAFPSERLHTPANIPTRTPIPTRYTAVGLATAILAGRWEPTRHNLATYDRAAAATRDALAALPTVPDLTAQWDLDRAEYRAAIAAGDVAAAATAAAALTTATRIADLLTFRDDLIPRTRTMWTQGTFRRPSLHNRAALHPTVPHP